MTLDKSASRDERVGTTVLMFMKAAGGSISKGSCLTRCLSRGYDRNAYSYICEL